MSYQQRARPRRDPGEDAIIDALKTAGCIVKKCSDKGMPDLMVMIPGTEDAPGKVCMLEVKAPEGPRKGKSASGQSLNAEQQKFFELVRGKNLPIYVCRSPNDALAALGIKES